MAAPGICRFCGGVALAGALAAVPADIVSWLLARDYSPIGQTISALAVGPSSWLIDLGLWAFALACVAVGVGCASCGCRPGLGRSRRWPSWARTSPWRSSPS